jgi:predicted esterase YcpF (UPF0227 family)
MSKIFIGNNKKIIISFSGQGNGMGTIPQFEFVNFLEKNYNNYNRYFYLDKYSKWYHKGIEGISTNINETLTYLKEIINKFEEVIFIGSSAGGYSAILFGSLLNVNKIIAFKPQTIIKPQKDIDNNYLNLKQYINTTTKYYIYGDINIDKNTDYLHHISHCENINIYPNIFLNREYEIDLKKLRDKGILKNIMDFNINNK